LEEIMHGQLATVIQEVLQIWLDNCADSTTEMDEVERDCLLKRDRIVRSKSIEVDLTANLPRMFGPDVSSRVITEIRKAFGVQEP
jgi:red chlorophyll catabolite reductase